MATQLSEEQGNSNDAEPAAGTCSSSNQERTQHNPWTPKYTGTYIEEVLARARSAPSLFGGVSENSERYRPLLRAAFKGDWESATRFFERHPASQIARITSRSETLLHIAALSAQDQFLENLVKLLSPNLEVLEMVDRDGRTALHNAVLCGRIRMVKALVGSNPKLTQLANNEGRVPLGISALEASLHKEIAWFLAKSTTDDGPSRPFSSPSAIKTFIDLAYAGHHDIVLYLVGRYPHLKTMKNTKNPGGSILAVLMGMESHFPSGTKLSVVEALIYKCIPVNLNYKPTNKSSDPGFLCNLIVVLQYLTRSFWNAAKIVVPKIKRVHEVKLRHVAAIELAKQICIALSSMNITEIINFFEDDVNLLFQATTKGISELVKLCIQFFPELIRILPYRKSLAMHAMVFRQERTLRLFLKVSLANEVSLVPAPTPQESFHMMTAVSKYDPRFDSETSVAGAAFKLQRELQWYKAVEKWVAPIARVSKTDNKTYWNIFEENHKGLLKSGEKWTKDTANSCMLISTLIATVLFAAAFTVPGGNNNNSGVPLLLGEDSLLIFAISDALGLFSSVTAILLFLAILTSRYEVQDFLHSLPKKIIMGLSLLFLSLAFMLVAFAATLTIVLDKRLEWVLIPITFLASIPVALFAILQLPLLYQMVKSTFRPSIFRLEGIWDGVDYTKQD